MNKGSKGSGWRRNGWLEMENGQKKSKESKEKMGLGIRLKHKRHKMA